MSIVHLEAKVLELLRLGFFFFLSLEFEYGLEHLLWEEPHPLMKLGVARNNIWTAMCGQFEDRIG